MPENNTATQPAPVVETDVEVKEVVVSSEEKQEINNILKAQEKYPLGATCTRFDVTLPLAPKNYGRGNKKSYGCKYIGIPKEFFKKENTAKLYEYIGEEKVLGLFEAYLNQNCAGATENAIDDNGMFNFELALKGIQEFSARGEPSTELRERYKEANLAYNAFMAQPNWVKYLQVGPDGKPVHPVEFKEFNDISEEMAYCFGTLNKRLKGKRDTANS